MTKKRRDARLPLGVVEAYKKTAESLRYFIHAGAWQPIPAKMVCQSEQEMFMQLLWSRAFVLAFVANFFLSLSFYLLIPTLPVHLIEGLHIPAGLAGLALSAYVVAGLLVRPFTGALIDRFARKALYVLVFAAFVLCVLPYAWVNQFAGWIILRVLHGLVWGLILPAGNTYVLDIVPPQRRGEGLGYYGMGMNLAMALGPWAGIWILETSGFDKVVVAAALAAFAGLIAAVGMPSLPKGPRHQQQDIKGVHRVVLVEALPGAIAMLLVTLSYGVMLAYASWYGKEMQISGHSYFFMLVAIGFVAARVAGSRRLDRGGTVSSAMGGALLSAVAMILLAWSPNSLVYGAAALLAGLAYGLVFPALQHWVLGRAAAHRRGTANATYFTAFDLGVGGGMALGGWFVAADCLQSGWLVVAGFSVLSFLLAWRLK